jgi:hypothetical protein
MDRYRRADIERLARALHDQPGVKAAHAALWDAVNAYAAACGGDPSASTVSRARMGAVVAVDEAVGECCVAWDEAHWEVFGHAACERGR